jgi:DNA-binding transcriptional regulator YhcF (GntR family)
MMRRVRIQIDRSSRVPVAEQLVRRLREGIERGRPEPGARLAPVRALAGELGLAPNTVAKAYRVLEREGYVRARGRAGTFVAVTLPRRTGDAAARLDAAADAFARRARQLGASDADTRAALVRAMTRRSPTG